LHHKAPKEHLKVMTHNHVKTSDNDIMAAAI